MRKLLLVFMIICMAGSVFAISDSDIDISTVKDNIMQDESAKFTVNILNNGSVAKDIKMYSPDVEWTIVTTTITAYPKKEVSEDLVIKPTKYISPGMYGINLHFKDLETEELIKKVLFVNVKPPGQAVSNYVPSVTLEATMEKKIVPGENIIITAIIENQNTLLLEGSELKIRSDLEVFNTDEEVDINSLEKKALELTYAVDDLQEPGTYSVSFELERNGQELARGEPIEVEVTQSTPNYEEEVEVDKGFLRTTEIVTYTSNSNIADVQTKKVGSGIFKRLFTETSVESKVIEDEGKKHLVFDLELGPGETKKVWITTNYRVLLYAIVVILMGLFVYFKYKSPLKVIKSVSNVQMKEGGISNLKIMLQIKNNSNKKLKDVQVVDYVPNIADVSKDFIEGTLKPSKLLMHEKKGTILKWELSEIAPGEERLISYNIKSKLSIIGNFKLPRGKVIFKQKKREIYSYSNTLGVNA